MTELVGAYFTILSFSALIPLAGVYALFAIAKCVMKRGDWWFLHAFDLLACPLAIFIWLWLTSMDGSGKSLWNVCEPVYPCWAWCVFIIVRAILNLKGVAIAKRTWSLWGCASLVAAVIAAYFFVPPLPE